MDDPESSVDQHLTRRPITFHCSLP